MADQRSNLTPIDPLLPHHSGGSGAVGRLLRLRTSSALLQPSDSSSSPSTAASSSGSSSPCLQEARRRRRLPLGCSSIRALGTKGGGGGAPHPELFLAELFGGVVNKPREGTVGEVGWAC